MQDWVRLLTVNQPTGGLIDIIVALGQHDHDVLLTGPCHRAGYSAEVTLIEDNRHPKAWKVLSSTDFCTCGVFDGFYGLAPKAFPFAILSVCLG